MAARTCHGWKGTAMNTNSIASQLPSTCATRRLASGFAADKCKKRPSIARFTPRPLIGRYTILPVELFRVNATDKIRIRDYETQRSRGQSAFDCYLGEDGLVHPTKGDMFVGPNEASVRPYGTMLQEIVHAFEAKHACLYRIPEGTVLPPDLVCLHEYKDHHSLQCSRPMPLATLNKLLTRFCKEHGEYMTKNEFIDRYDF